MAEVTNYIDRLVAELCPEGVEYKPLGSFARLVGGSGMPKTDFSESGVGAIHYGQIYTKFGTATAEVIAHVPEEKAKKLAVVNPGDVIVANTSENLEDVCKAVAWVGDSDIVTGGHATVIKAPEQNAKFISYYMATGQFNKDKRRHAFGTKVIDVAPKNLAKIEFPVPPLEIQEAIVEILDKFTNLEAELEAELEARTLQYEYYRDSLFEALDCPRVPLGSFARLVRGSGMPKTDFSESGVGAIHYGQIYTKFGTATAEVIAHVPEEKAKKLAVVNPGDVIVANTSENLEDVCKAVAWVGDSDIVTGGHATVIKAPEQNAKFISYYMATGQFNKDKRRHAFGTKVIDVAPKNLAKIEFPLPSLEEQQRIVDILDRFDALTASLSEGLPAELAARRSQYEYYRDQLLTFPRKGENQ